MKKAISLLLILSLFLSLSLPALAVSEGSSVPAWSLTTLDGKTINQDTYSGKTQLLVFYRASLNDSGAGRCFNSNSLISSLAESEWVGNDKLKVIAIDVDNNDASTVTAYKQKYAPNNNSIVFALNGNSFLWSLFSGSLTLACCAIVQDGTVACLRTGVYSAEDCRQDLADVMGDSGSGSTYIDARITGTFCYDYARQQLSMINSFRTGSEAWYWSSNDKSKTEFAAGELGALMLDPKLEKIAMERARELAVYYSHTRPNGERCFSLTADGYQSYGENIAYGFTTPESVFTAWREDSEPYSGQGHRRNMLNSGYTAVGFGCFCHNGVYYWAQEFSYVFCGEEAASASDEETTGFVQYSTELLGDNYWSDEGNCKTADQTASPTITKLSADKTSACVGESIVWTVNAYGGSGSLQYAFHVYKNGSLVAQSAYGTSRTYTYTPDEAGTYYVEAFVKDSSGRTSSRCSSDTEVTAAAPAISSIKADKTAAKVGEKITWSAAASGGSGSLRYCFYIYQDGAVIEKGGYGSAKTYSFTPSAAGSYTAKVFVKDASGAVVSKLSAAVSVSAAPAVSSIKADKTAAKVGEKITWSASASGGSGSLRYCFYVYQDGAVIEKGGYGSAKTYSFTPSAAGSYTAKVFVKDASGTVVSKLSAAVSVSAGSTAPAVSSIKADKTAAAVGEKITWTAAASGGSGALQYCFYVYKDGAVVKKGSYGSAKTFSYTPSAAGSYTAKVFVKDASGAAVNKLSAAVSVSAGSGAPAVSSIKADKTAAAVGEKITWTAAASGGSGTLQYCFYVYKDGAIAIKGSYGSAKTFSYSPSAAGGYTAKVFVKDASGTVVNKLSAAVSVSAGSGAPAISSIKADKTAAAVGEKITWSAAASGGSGTLQYCFYVYKDSAIVKKGSYGSAKTFSYTPSAAGSYTAKVFVKDASGTVVNKLSAAVSVSAGSGAPAVSSIKADRTAAAVGEKITWTAAASSGSGTLQYCFYVYKDSAIVKKGSYGSAKTFSYTPSAAGSYTAKVFVKDASGTVVSKLSAGTAVTG